MNDVINILLVDDEPLVLEMFESMLSHEGYHVETATNSKDAMKLLQSSSYHVAIFDVMMDDYDGFELLAAARAKDAAHSGSPTGVILITGAPSDNDRERARVRGARYLAKPIGFDELLAAVSDSAVESGAGKKRVVHG